jgi:diaminohydroxyphosphoribosylaminopyrimidine deaminase/5-amino-6-(5-phosphoribosylamino)uracil reductase
MLQISLLAVTFLTLSLMHSETDQLYMQRCLQLALNGASLVAPNPLVGAVLVHDGRIIGEGYHERFGEPHAEVNAINSVKPEDKHLIKSATLYVNLEPCSHFGKTPPCADRVIKEGIPKVVIANTDPNPLVSGNGINKLREAGCEVVTGVLQEEGEWLNRRFFIFQREKRPYIILKWAQSADGFFTKKRTEQHWITGDATRRLVHRWRTEEASILVGSGTAGYDNPRLDVRFWPGGAQPLRLVYDRHLQLPNDLHLFDKSVPTLVFTEMSKKNRKNVEHVYQRNIQSLIVEGGERTLTSFIEAGLWDEARVFTGKPFFSTGIHAPRISGDLIGEDTIGDDRLYYFRNPA